MRDKVLNVPQGICDKIENGEKEYLEGQSFEIDLLEVDGEKYAILKVQRHDWQTGKDSNPYECLMTEEDYKTLIAKFHETMTLNL
jgi:hypothetical protein